MPSKDFHVCRLTDGAGYTKFRSEKRDDGRTFRYGIKDGKSELYEIFYPKARFTATQAKESCKRHDGRFEQATTNATTIANVSVLQASLALREERLNGRPYLIAPVVLMVEGVHEGSGGPVYYPAEELAKFPAAWNGVPLPVFHPTKDGEPISANSPDVIEEQSIGQLFNVYFDPNGAKLKGEIWIDTEKARRISPEVLVMIRDGKPLEVSTGVYVEEDGTPGKWRGENYEATARNLRPDHLALLPGERGACSWEDGCGVRVNEEVGNPVKTHSGIEWFRSWIRATAQSLGFLVNDAPDENDTTTTSTGEVTDKDISVQTSTTTSDDDVPVVDWRMITAQKEEPDMAKDELIATLIACKRTRFTDDDKAWLETLDECRLKSLQVVEVEEPEEPEEKTEVKAPESEGKTEEAAVTEVAVETVEEPPQENQAPPTVDEYVANAPPEIQETLKQGVAELNARRDALITALMENPRNTFTKDELQAKSRKELEALSQLGNVPVTFDGRQGGPANTDPNAVPPMKPVFNLEKNPE